jgi:tight adherence protein C
MVLAVIVLAILIVISIYSLLTFIWGTYAGSIHRDRLTSIKDQILSSNMIRVDGKKAHVFGPESVSASGEKVDYAQALAEASKKRYVVPTYKIVIAILLCLTAGFFLLVALYNNNIDSTTLTLAGVAMAGITLYVPRFMFLQQKKKMAEEIALTFPNAIDLINVCLEAGSGFDQALFRVSFEIKQMAPLLSEEFIRINQEVNAGKPREKALADMALRLGVDEVTSVVMNIIQAEKLGGSLVGSLRIQAATLRDKTKQRMRAKIAKVPVKLIFPMALTLLPVIMLIILGPVMISIYKNIVVK